jgi:hypothetical protein
LKWADAHHRKTGEWPRVKSGQVLGVPNEKWANIDAALVQGGRSLPGGSSLAKLLAEKRGVRNMGGLPDLTIKQVLQWADAHNQTTGKWPKSTSGDVMGASGEKWVNIQAALVQGGRSLPGGSSLAQLLAEERGVRNVMDLPDLTIKQILQWADAHNQKTGEWPKLKSGQVLGAPNETWLAIEVALTSGNRGLPGGSSLAKLLAEERGVRNLTRPPVLTVKQILQWADAHNQKTGEWPKSTSGGVMGASGEKWANIRTALVQGGRSLPGGSSLAQLLAEERGVRNLTRPPDLTIKQILQWAIVHHQKIGEWPKITSGDVMGASGEKWGNINTALRQGLRGLSGGSSLAQLLAKKRAGRGAGNTTKTRVA